MKKKALKIILVSLGILVATLSVVIILAVSSFRTLDKESDFYYYEYEDSDGSMVGVLDINFPSFVGGHVEDFLRNCIKEIVIPEEIDGETVRACGMFWGCGNLKSVTIPESVTRIGDYAFDGCYDLENIEIPNGVTSIGNAAFASCHSLQNIILPNTVEEIDEYAFVSCYGLKSIEIPERVTTIERGLFCDCSGLENVIMMNDVEEIGESVFEACRSLETITFGGDVSSNDFDPLLYVEKNVTFIVPKGSVVGNWALENGYKVECYVPGEVIGSPKSDEYYEDYIETSSYNSSAYNGAITPMSSAKVGDVVAFGSYEQDGNESNGKEEIVWYVVDKEGNKALLFSVYILDKDWFDTSNTDTFWIDSTLREWLNDEFANTAFTSDELEKIQTTQMTTVESTGSGYYDQATSTTYDKVFLMGFDELKYYFGCEGSTTDYRWEHSGDTRMYAEATPSSNMGTGTKMMTDNGTVYLHDWWLRQGSSYGHASYVSYAEVNVIGGSARSYSKGIRPVIWVNTQ